MKRILFFLLIFANIALKAQDYSCFVPGTKQYFTNVNGYLRGMRID